MGSTAGAANGAVPAAAGARAGGAGEATHVKSWSGLHDLCVVCICVAWRGFGWRADVVVYKLLRETCFYGTDACVQANQIGIDLISPQLRRCWPQLSCSQSLR